MDVMEKLDSKAHRVTIDLQRIGNRAVRKAQEENRRLGIPNAYSINGQIFYQLPNGEITMEDPFENDDAAAPQD